jgi:tetratricopeptide (TPR) repeat protein
MKNKETLLFVGVALIAGLLIGVLIVGGNNKPAGTSAGPAQQPAVNYQQNIKLLEGMVAADANNRNAWVELGHNYFDSQQPIKAIEAYDKALALDPADPDVITNQGVMFRSLGWYDRAIDNFTRANEMKPSHPQSLYNLGIVYRYDLQDFAKAKEVWSRYLTMHPMGAGADQVRGQLEMINSHPQFPPKQ